jgi:hypothetical protein
LKEPDNDLRNNADLNVRNDNDSVGDDDATVGDDDADNVVNSAASVRIIIIIIIKHQ